MSDHQVMVHEVEYLACGAGTTYTSTQISEMAGRAAANKKKATAEADSLSATKDRLERIVAMMTRRERKAGIGSMS